MAIERDPLTRLERKSSSHLHAGEHSATGRIVDDLLDLLSTTLVDGRLSGILTENSDLETARRLIDELRYTASAVYGFIQSSSRNDLLQYIREEYLESTKFQQQLRASYTSLLTFCAMFELEFEEKKAITPVSALVVLNAFRSFLSVIETHSHSKQSIMHEVIADFTFEAKQSEPIQRLEQINSELHALNQHIFRLMFITNRDLDALVDISLVTDVRQYLPALEQRLTYLRNLSRDSFGEIESFEAKLSKLHRTVEALEVYVRKVQNMTDAELCTQRIENSDIKWMNNMIPSVTTALLAFLQNEED